MAVGGPDGVAVRAVCSVLAVLVGLAVVRASWDLIYFEPTGEAVERAAGGRTVMVVGAGVTAALGVIARVTMRRGVAGVFLLAHAGSTLVAATLLDGTLFPPVLAVLALGLVATAVVLLLLPRRPGGA